VSGLRTAGLQPAPVPWLFPWGLILRGGLKTRGPISRLYRTDKPTTIIARPGLNPSSPAPVVAVSSRLAWLDAWRGLAVLWMIETHCFNAFRDADWLQSAWFPWLNYANGLVAPSFLFIAGFVQGHAMRRVWERGESLRINRSRVTRLAAIFALGYALRLPLVAWLGGTESFVLVLVRWLCTVDILSCLAVSLGLLLVLGRICQDGRKFDFLAVIFAFGCVALAPVASSWTQGNQLSSLALTWTNRSYGALFPLLPWFGFAALGAVCSRWRGHAGVFAMGAVAAWIASQLIPQNFGDYSHAQPAFFLERLSWVLLLGAGFASCRTLTELKLLQFVGKNSLGLYVIHLQIIYTLLLNLSGFKNMAPPVAVWISLPITLAGSLGVAWLLTRYVYPNILKRRSA